jgi:superfamily I DNA/RNA helicase
MKLCKIYGPPGTGKTYRLISRARAYARTGSPLHKIGYFAFTKKAAKEAKERMPFPPKRLRHFQTLHSLAFNTLSLSEDRVMQPYHYEDLGKLLNIRVRYQDKFNKEETHFLTCDNPYYQLIGRAMNKDISIEEEFNLNEHNRNDVSWNTLKHISTNLVEYKKNNNPDRL